MQIEHSLVIVIPGMIAAAALLYGYAVPLGQTLIEHFREKKGQR